MTDERRAAWLARQLAQAPPLTEQQRADLRRVLTPPRPIKRPA